MDDEKPEADVMEQREPAHHLPTDGPVEGLPDEADPADVAEQQRAVPELDDDVPEP